MEEPGIEPTTLWVVDDPLYLLIQGHFHRMRLCDTDLSYVQEYETQSSPEARLVKQFDLLEMILQAHEYEELEATPGRLQEFFDSTNGKSLTPVSLLLS